MFTQQSESLWMMEQTNMAKLLIAVLCCSVVAGMNVPIDSTAETRPSAQNRFIRGYERRGIRSTSTNRSPFICADGSGSINRTLLCNGRIDCVDSSDENSQICLGISCMRTFPCLNGQCINLDFRCNGLDDCGDNSDEDLSICQQLPSSQVIICANGQVLKGVNILCNGVNNCMDKSDESYLTCIVNTPRPTCPQYTCPSGKCIYFTDVCDGYNDCGDRSDERSCSSTTILQTTTSTTICSEHTCPSGKCIQYNDVCDGFYDCDDYSDESDCTTTKSYSYTSVATGVSVPGVVVIFVGGCYGCRRRRMRVVTRTTTTTTAAVAVITTTAVASDLPPSYSEVVEASAPSHGIVNPAYADSASVSK